MDIGDLVKTLGTPFANSQKKLIKFSKFLYHIAFVNKAPLTYLFKYVYDRKCRRLYNYHSLRLRALLDVVSKVSRVLEECGFRYAVFKTLGLLMKMLLMSIYSISVLTIMVIASLWRL